MRQSVAGSGIQPDKNFEFRVYGFESVELGFSKRPCEAGEAYSCLAFESMEKSDRRRLKPGTIFHSCAANRWAIACFGSAPMI